jgi:hypothetical protein
VFIDSSAESCRLAELAGFRALFGSGISESVLRRAEVDTQQACIGITSNDEINYTFARRVREDFKVPQTWVGLRKGHVNIHRKTVEGIGARILFGKPRNLDLWNVRIERGRAAIQHWVRRQILDSQQEEHTDPDRFFLPLLATAGRSVSPAGEIAKLAKGAGVYAAIVIDAESEASAWLTSQGWVRAEKEPGSSEPI